MMGNKQFAVGMLVLAVALLVTLGGCTLQINPEEAGASDGGADPAAAFLGTWNYDHPNPETSTNIAQISCPGPDGGAGQVIMVPQIGNIIITKASDHTIEIRTDQGCFWRFAVEANTAMLNPAAQSCHNPVSKLMFRNRLWRHPLGRRLNTVSTWSTSHFARTVMAQT
jgi:hypothetical protein